MAMKRQVCYLTAGAVMLMFCSLPYSWAMFAAPVTRAFGWSAEAVGFTFSVGLAGFCIGGIVSGILQRRYGIRPVLFGGILLMAAGFLILTGMSGLLSLYLGFGGLLCLGAGILYNGALSQTLIFFPGNAGRISGVLLMSFGCGASVIGSLLSALDNHFGLRAALGIVGLLITAVQVAGSLVLTGGLGWSALTPGGKENRPDMEPAADRRAVHEAGDTFAMLRCPSFWFYFFWTVLLGSAALIVVGNSAAIAASLGQGLAVVAFCAGLVSIFNGLGRIVFGWILDVAGSCITFAVVTAVFMSGSLLLYYAAASMQISVLMISYGLLGLSYGGIFPCNSAYIRAIFGSRNFAIHFSIINMSVLAAGFIGPMLAGPMLQKGGVPASLLMMGMTLAGALCLPGIRRQMPSKAERKIL